MKKGAAGCHILNHSFTIGGIRMHKQWWKEAVVYQIYPQSFQDSNGDGFGDLNGIITRLDYLKELGVDVLWLCPIFDSPMFDNGYDVKDYYGIMEKFGTLEDFERLLCRAHEKGLRVVLDAVFNHTSDQHPWFVESRRRDSKYRDYYVWADPVDGHEPNNWMSVFGGSAWEHDSASDAYYMHLFFKQQPDLNWENPAVRRELRKILEFWCEKGVDGFRFDAINLFSKPEDMSDWPDPYRIGDYANGKHTHPYLQELLNGLDDKYNIMLVGQTDNVCPEDALLFAGFDRGEFQMIFQYELDNYRNNGPTFKWHTQVPSVLEIKEIFTRWQQVLADKAWNTVCLGSHDMPRSVSRYGNDQIYHKESAKMLATFQMSLQGTAFIYQGDELGMTNTVFDTVDDFLDDEARNFYHDFVDSGKISNDEFMKAARFRARDNARTPMQWDATENAGFTNGIPWMRVNPNYLTINAAAQMADENSILSYYKQLLSIRKQHDVFVYGRYELTDASNPAVYSFLRILEDEELLVLCNFTAQEAKVAVPADFLKSGVSLLLGNYATHPEPLKAEISIRPYEARIYLRKKDIEKEETSVSKNGASV